MALYLGSPSVLPGILLKIVSTLCFTLMAASVKWLGLRHPGGDMFPVGQVVFCRSFFALIPVLIYIYWQGEMRAAVATRRIGGHLRRSLIGIGGMFCGFAGLALLPLADATVISYASPLIVVMLAALLLKETVRIYRWSAVGIGFLGVVVAMAPHLSVAARDALSTMGALLAFAGAVFAAIAMIEVRRLTSTENTAAIVFYFSLFSSLIGLLTLPLGVVVPAWSWAMPGLADWSILVLIGVLGGLGQITLTAAYRRADTSVIAPFEYVSIIWATAVGYVAFGDAPGEAIIVGSAVIVASGLFVIYRENRLGLERKRQLEAAPPRPV
jgi:drug/metabolite transporter (DMT)-like permease